MQQYLYYPFLLLLSLNAAHNCIAQLKPDKTATKSCTRLTLHEIQIRFFGKPYSTALLALDIAEITNASRNISSALLGWVKLELSFH